MKTKKYSKKVSLLLTIILLLATFAFSQSGEPRQEKLLNGLKLLVWQNAKDPKISIKLRIHSGSAFDPKDKMGVTKLLSEILFPNNLTREFFEQDLEGSLSVTSNYDYIQIDASGKSEKFLDIIETLATAVTNPDISQENFLSVRKTLLEQVLEEQKNAAIVADQAVAKKLFGDYPYGRPQNGTPESLAKLDRIDLTIARDKFLTADNATLTISGNVNFALALKASKQFFGGWKKSDKLVPASFKQPDEVDTKTQIIESNIVDKNEVRYAFRGIARNDDDFFAMKFLVGILSSRESGLNNWFIKYQRNLLPSLVVSGVSNASEEFIKASESSDKTAKSLFESKLFANLTVEEFNKTKLKILTEIEQKPTQEKWLDITTFKLNSVKGEMQKLNSVTLADVQRVADKLSKQNVATVVLTKSADNK
jgi:predicted Zn-dependent peptidase